MQINELVKTLKLLRVGALLASAGRLLHSYTVTQIGKTFLSIHGRFSWYLKVSKRITQGTSFTSRVSNENVA